MNEGNGGRGLIKRRILSDQSSHQAFTWRLLLSPIEPSQSYLKQLDLTRPVSIVGYRELHNHTFQTSWDAMVWYFYDQFYSSRACYQGGPGPRFRPRKRRTQTRYQQSAALAPVTGLQAPCLGHSRDWTCRGFRDRDRAALLWKLPPPSLDSSKTVGLSVGSRGPRLQSRARQQLVPGFRVTWVQLSPGEASSESEERDSVTRSDYGHR